MAALVVGLGFVGAWYEKSRPAPAELPSEPNSVVPARAASAGPGVDARPPALDAPPVGFAAPMVPSQTASTWTSDDVTFLQKVGIMLGNPGYRPSSDELARVKSLADAQPGGEIRKLQAFLQTRLAQLGVRERRFSEARARLNEAKTFDATIPQIYAVEAVVCSEERDWAGAESAARRAEQLGDASVETGYALAFALFRQDRNADAIPVLDREPMRQYPPARELRAQIEGQQRAEGGKDQFSSDRFNVRFDGEAHDGVARDVLRILDRYYFTLADTYGYRPKNVIPVVLYSQRDYYTATGAPAWSGGVYDNHSGRIGIPIRGMPSDLDAEGASTVLHELSHAFVAEMTGGAITDARDLNEGLAQYMEGDRIESRLSPQQLKRLANDPRATVGDFYMIALLFAQSLVNAHGQTTVNSILNAMAETGSADAAFQKILGYNMEEARKRALETFWRRYS